MRLTTLLGPRSLTLLLNRGTRPLWQNCKTSRFTEATQSAHFSGIAHSARFTEAARMPALSELRKPRT